ncbi:MAG TPA: hypothetical protein VF815_13875, partial [Myxococcaceae bacterium]
MNVTRRFERVDSARPEAPALPDAVGERLALTAFSLLPDGGTSEYVPGLPPPNGEGAAASYARSRLELLPHGAAPAIVERVLRDVTRQLAGNPVLVARLEA